jgi:hypothetical protein
MALWESLVVAAAGIVLGLVAAGTTTASATAAVSNIVEISAVTIPWALLGAATGGAVIAVGSVSVMTTLAETRWRPVDVAGARSATVFPLTATGGRYRLVGLDLRRPRTWFHWDPQRHTKTAGIQLDLGRFFKIGITPDDADQLLADLQAHPQFTQRSVLHRRPDEFTRG